MRFQPSQILTPQKSGVILLDKSAVESFSRELGKSRACALGAAAPAHAPKPATRSPGLSVSKTSGPDQAIQIPGAWRSMLDDAGIRLLPMRAALAALVSLASSSAAMAALPPAEMVAIHRPADGVYAIVQAPDGFLWLGTTAGLFRFDGARFTRMDGISGRVTSLALAGDGTLWVATLAQGLFRVRGGTLEAFKPPGLSDVIQAIALDGAGQLWIGSSEGIHRWDGRQLTKVTPGEVITLFADGARVWVGTAAGVDRIGGGGYETLDRIGQVRDFARDGRGRVWIASLEGLFFDDGHGIRPIDPKHLVDGKQFGARSLHVDGRGALWIGTWTWLYRLDLDDPDAVAKPHLLDQLKDFNIETVASDRDGTIWLGSAASGLLAVTAEPAFANLGKQENLAGRVAFAVHGARDGSVWITASEGLSRWRDGKFVNYRAPRDYPANDLRSIAESRDGTMWFGGFRSGLVRWSGQAFAKVPLSDDDTQSLFVDRDDHLWVASRHGGLTELAGEQVTVHTPAEVGCARYVQAMAQDPSGTLWFASAGSGLGARRGGSFRVYTRKDGLPSDDITALHADAHGDLWVGTFDRGLAHHKDGRFTALGVKQGLTYEHIGQILEDRHGYLWIASRAGLLRVSRAELLEVVAGRRRTVQPIPFGAPDGMRSGFCVFGFQPAGSAQSDGRLWVPTTQGVTIVDPDRLLAAAVPPVVIEEVLLNGAAVATQELEAPVGRGNLEVRYTVAKLAHRHRIKFRYRLAGFDQDWVAAGDRQIAYYTNLPPGRHRFEVTAFSVDGGATQAVLAMHLLPPFHRTRVFYIACLLAVLALAGAGLRLRLWQERQRFAAVVDERNRIARDLHDTLEQSFVGIKLQLEAAATQLEAPETARPHLTRAVQLVERGIADSRSSVFALRTGIFGAADLPTAVSVMAGQSLRGTKVDVRQRTTGEPYRLPTEKEQAIVRIVGEAIVNIVKHAAASRLDLHLDFTAGAVRVTIEDDGRGFDPAVLPSSAGGGHYGILGMRERASQLGGTLEVTSRPGAGARLTLTVPR